MDALKKIIHPHKADHGHDSNVTTTDQQHAGKAHRSSDTGDNLANPFSESNDRAAEGFRQQHATEGTQPRSQTVGGAQTEHHLGQGGADRTAAHGYGTGLGAPTEGAGHHDRHQTTSQSAGAGGAGAGTELSDSYGPGVNTGGAQVVDARMPEEVGNNFPGTNPKPAHDALGTMEEGGLKYAGRQ